MTEKNNEGTGTDPADKKKSSSGDSSWSGCGCLVAVVVIAAIGWLSFDKSDFYLMPGEANMWLEAMDQSFEEIERVTPDSLEVRDPLNAFDHIYDYVNVNEANIVYIVNPKIRTVLKSDTTRQYTMQYLARVDHVDADEFVIKDFVIDTIYARQEAGPGY